MHALPPFERVYQCSFRSRSTSASPSPAPVSCRSCCRRCSAPKMRPRSGTNYKRPTHINTSVHGANRYVASSRDVLTSLVELVACKGHLFTGILPSVCITGFAGLMANAEGLIVCRFVRRWDRWPAVVTWSLRLATLPLSCSSPSANRDPSCETISRYSLLPLLSVDCQHVVMALLTDSRACCVCST